MPYTDRDVFRWVVAIQQLINQPLSAGAARDRRDGTEGARRAPGEDQATGLSRATKWRNTGGS